MTLRFVLLVWLAFGVASVCASGSKEPSDKPESSAKETIEPADVYIRVALLRDEIELIRQHLGKPANKQPDLKVKNAVPREVFFQSITLFRIVDRLSFDLTRQSAKIREIPTAAIRPFHVYEVVNQTIARVQFIKKYLKIESVVKPLARNPDITPTEVFRSIVQANRQVNLLLQEQFSSSDVFQQVTLAVGYSARLQAAFPGPRIQRTPGFKPDKRSSDVYQQLVQCFQMVRTIARISNIKILDLQEYTKEDATPSDVYAVASLLVSELAFLHQQLDGAKPLRPVVYPGVKTPSDAYQRAMLLQSQLINLNHWASQKTDWLAKKQNP